MYYTNILFNHPSQFSFYVKHNELYYYYYIYEYEYVYVLNFGYLCVCVINNSSQPKNNYNNGTILPRNKRERDRMTKAWKLPSVAASDFRRQKEEILCHRWLRYVVSLCPCCRTADDAPAQHPASDRLLLWIADCEAQQANRISIEISSNKKQKEREYWISVIKYLIMYTY